MQRPKPGTMSGTGQKIPGASFQRPCRFPRRWAGPAPSVPDAWLRQYRDLVRRERANLFSPAMVTSLIAVPMPGERTKYVLAGALFARSTPRSWCVKEVAGLRLGLAEDHADLDLDLIRLQPRRPPIPFYTCQADLLLLLRHPSPGSRRSRRANEGSKPSAQSLCSLARRGRGCGERRKVPPRQALSSFFRRGGAGGLYPRPSRHSAFSGFASTIGLAGLTGFAGCVRVCTSFSTLIDTWV